MSRNVEEPRGQRYCANLDEALQIFDRDPLLFRPGTQYSYSIYGWILVSAVVEAAAGEPFPTFMTREVFESVSVDDTVLDGEEVQGRASFYFPRSFMRTDLGLKANGDPRLSLEDDIEASTTTCNEFGGRRPI